MLIRDRPLDYYFKPSVAAVNTTIIAMQQRIRLAQEAKDPGASASKKGKGKTEPAEAKSDEQAELDEFVRKRIETVVNARLVRSFCFQSSAQG
jgi:hypothetical protein